MQNHTNSDALSAQVQKVLSAVSSSSRDRIPESFYSVIKTTDIPFVSCTGVPNAGQHFKTLAELAYSLGQVCLPLTVGFAQHVYTLAAIATAPLEDGDFRQRTQKFLSDIMEQRLIVTVSSSANRISTASDKRFSVERVNGGFSLSGVKSIQSNSSFSDRLLFTAEIENEGYGLFICDHRHTPGVVLGTPIFNNAMRESDTRPLIFENAFLPSENLLSDGFQKETRQLHYFSRAWFQAMVVFPYMGAAQLALDAVIKFGQIGKTAESESLANSQYFRTELGRLKLKHSEALALAQSFPEVLERFCRNEADMNELYLRASLIKYVCSSCVQDVVDGARRIIGTRAMAPGHIVGELTSAITFCELHPETNRDIENLFADLVLSV